MSCLYTNRKNTTATKMREALTSNGGKVLTGAADTDSPAQEFRQKAKQTGNSSGRKFRQTAEFELT